MTSTFLKAGALTAALVLAGCATAPGPSAPRARQALEAGHVAEATKAALATFGTAQLGARDFRWAGDGATGSTDVVVSLSRQMAYVWRGGRLVGMTSISSGTDSHPTPTGFFPVQEKARFHRSNKYSNAPMPFMLRLDQYGIALHGGELPGYRASHGCVRLPMKFAEKLFAAASVGSNVYIEA